MYEVAFQTRFVSMDNGRISRFSSIYRTSNHKIFIPPAKGKIDNGLVVDLRCIHPEKPHEPP